jgi:hypothetical protein
MKLELYRLILELLAFGTSLCTDLGERIDSECDKADAGADRASAELTGRKECM